MIDIIIVAIFGLIIGIASNTPKTDEPLYIQFGGIVVAVIITYPIQLGIQILIENY